MKQSLSVVLLAIFIFFVTMGSSSDSALSSNDDDDEPSWDGTTEIVVDEYELTTNVPTYENVTDIEKNLQRTARDARSTGQRFRQEMLQAHNQYRARHCAPPLTLDTNLSNDAQKYAEYLVRLNTLKHSGIRGLGENLAWKGGSRLYASYSGREATSQWYKEISYYNYNRAGFSMKTGHFTQLVWKSSRRLGVGVAYNRAGTKVFVVARYSPPGNYGNQYKANVLPPRC